MKLKAKITKDFDLSKFKEEVLYPLENELLHELGQENKKVIANILGGQSAKGHHPLAKYAYMTNNQSSGRRNVVLRRKGPSTMPYQSLRRFVQFKRFYNFVYFGFGRERNTFDSFLERIAKRKQKGQTVEVKPKMRRLFGAAYKKGIPGYKPLKKTTTALNIPARPHNEIIKRAVKKASLLIAHRKLEKVKL